MSEVANIYDNGPISPVCQIKENLMVYTANKWQAFSVMFIEPVPMSRPLVVNFCTAAAPTIAGLATTAKRVLTVIQMQQMELFHVRWFPIDDVKGYIWELAQAARFDVRGGQASVTMFSRLFDPYLATTTFFVMGGQNTDPQIACFNPSANLIYSARIAFFGFRYLLQPRS